ncbi:hypothetical protein BC829DRAFT_30798 [Chytridium lagenaria]|nr:hypothetical protein BC829DRAFT_30798 [Chytridium lagenaria]
MNILVLLSRWKPWRKVFWRIWALITHMYCSTCESMVSLFDYNACLRHPLDIVFPPGECQKGRYPCCDSTELRFNPFVLSKGCQKAKHDFDCSSETFQMFLANMDDILEPTDKNQNEPPKLNDRDGLIKIFGKWSEGIYRRMESSNIAISMMSGPVGVGPLSVSPKAVPQKKLPAYLQRCEDSTRMATITKQLISLRDTKVA